jgi:hypothetical protein
MRIAAGAAIALAAVVGLAAVVTRHQNPQIEAARSERQLEPAAARSVALSLAGLVERNFVSPETARQYASTIRARAGTGAYDRLPSRNELAAALTADLQAVAPDGHLAVFASFPPPLDPAPPGTPPAIEVSRWIAPGIAFLRPTVFSGSAAELAAIRRFLSEHASARTLIIDMRSNHGGGLAEMDEIFDAVFARPTRLAILETRAGAGPVPFRAGPRLLEARAPAGASRLEHWALPRPGGGALRNARLFVLVSHSTVSAGEHFSFVLKRTRRATLIGATTRGAGNYGGLRSIGQGMAVFIPVGRTFDPDTGEGWEGIGVSPDISVPARQAVVEALTRSGVTTAEAWRLSDLVAPSGPVAA